ncbi:hypothetical protein BD626DRAFT_245655 [Schizophyllum amplum]|uniref:Uncharacterized protein n=1 Tax=Schizophyllum amplum TaxID=97359 RepID=A0A550BVR2_9AGAR|nr:hypothetical protein BD626DRAFT_245655 [Auriculariopsis ampla]
MTCRVERSTPSPVLSPPRRLAFLADRRSPFPRFLSSLLLALPSNTSHPPHPHRPLAPSSLSIPDPFAFCSIPTRPPRSPRVLLDPHAPLNPSRIPVFLPCPRIPVPCPEVPPAPRAASPSSSSLHLLISASPPTYLYGLSVTNLCPYLCADLDFPRLRRCVRSLQPRGTTLGFESLTLTAFLQCVSGVCSVYQEFAVCIRSSSSVLSSSSAHSGFQIYACKFWLVQRFI